MWHILYGALEFAVSVHVLISFYTSQNASQGWSMTHSFRKALILFLYNDLRLVHGNIVSQMKNTTIYSFLKLPAKKKKFYFKTHFFTKPEKRNFQLTIFSTEM